MGLGFRVEGLGFILVLKGELGEWIPTIIPM